MGLSERFLLVRRRDEFPHAIIIVVDLGHGIVSYCLIVNCHIKSQGECWFGLFHLTVTYRFGLLACYGLYGS